MNHMPFIKALHSFDASVTYYIPRYVRELKQTHGPICSILHLEMKYRLPGKGSAIFPSLVKLKESAL